jgi:hypothetical protein
MPNYSSQDNNIKTKIALFYLAAVIARLQEIQQGLHALCIMKEPA